MMLSGKIARTPSVHIVLLGAVFQAPGLIAVRSPDHQLVIVLPVVCAPELNCRKCIRQEALGFLGEDPTCTLSVSPRADAAESDCNRKCCR